LACYFKYIEWETSKGYILERGRFLDTEKMIMVLIEQLHELRHSWWCNRR
jgi:hypothetical protein